MTELDTTVLVVDDTPENIDILASVLQDTYKIKVAINGEKALQIAQKKPQPDLILLDVMMPVMDGYEVCIKLKANPLTANIPVIFITALSDEENEERGLKLGAVDYITKPISPMITKARVRTHLALANQKKELERQVAERTKDLQRTRMQIIQKLGRAGEFKDNETGMHVMRMSHYARLIAESVFDGPNEWTDLLFQVAPMHDIGKIGIPDKLLQKNGPLDEREWTLMRKHPYFGAEIIGEHESGILAIAHEVALNHHEKWDGTGYPNRLKGEDIPLSARIVAIADVFDALTSKRPYKEAWPVVDAVELIHHQSGRHFDPNLVTHFKSVLPEILKVKEKFADPGSQYLEL
ncbi:response regulator [Thiomicrorhabdus sp. ZW0627]|uniref:HD domain-containing phosphohydrolase n=1 Tax=Thiomicrorhabdus sp. ZW0627 TaxID=3039774 RepID=UPI00243644D1|nr:HD domain-containing phosphohydrolase [Thiomicrorhabdus sp. ZW0627]MDG6773241.1 response regulator [Thiomicrorhabdus sp. ZW0627]